MQSVLTQLRRGREGTHKAYLSGTGKCKPSVAAKDRLQNTKQQNLSTSSFALISQYA